MLCNLRMFVATWAGSFDSRTRSGRPRSVASYFLLFTFPMRPPLPRKCADEILCCAAADGFLCIEGEADGGDGAETLDNFREDIQDVLEVFLRGTAAQRKPCARVGELVGTANGEHNM